MMVSYSLKRSKQSNAHVRFGECNVNNWQSMFTLITTDVWSPMVWRAGYRSKNNFLSAQFIVLDFDHGATLAEIKQECETYGLWYILATTKSHQLPKGNEPPCDRFRLILKASSQCTNRELYEYNMKLFTQYWPCDVSCTDAGRFFWPCKEVYAYSTGRKVPWLPFEEDYEHESDRFRRIHERLRALGKGGIMPDWVADIFRSGAKIAVGERHKTCYQLGATWAHLGWDMGQLQTMVARTNLADIGQMEYERALNNGYYAVRGKVNE